MRLKDGNEPPALCTLAARRKRSRDLARVVRIIIDHGDIIHFARNLEAAIRPLEFGESGKGALALNAQDVESSEHAEAVEDVMSTWNAQGEVDVLSVRCDDLDVSARSIRVIGDYPPRRFRVFAIQHNAKTCIARIQGKGVRAGVVRTRNERAVRLREPRGECRENRAEVLFGAVEVEMVGLEVREHENRGSEGDKGTVGLVRLHDRIFTRALARVRTELCDRRTNRPGGLDARCAQGQCCHRTRRSLAVSARDSDDRMLAKETREPRCPVNHGDRQLVRAAYFGVIGTYGSRHDHEIGVLFYGVGVETDGDTCTEFAQGWQEPTFLGFGARDFEARFEREARDGAHTRPADADHVDLPDVLFGPRGSSHDRAGPQHSAHLPRGERAKVREKIARRGHRAPPLGR